MNKIIKRRLLILLSMFKSFSLIIANFYKTLTIDKY